MLQKKACIDVNLYIVLNNVCIVNLAKNHIYLKKIDFCSLLIFSSLQKLVLRNMIVDSRFSYNY